MSGAGESLRSWSRRSATPGTRFRRSPWRGRWPGAATRWSVESWERWREAGRGVRAGLRAAEEYRVFPPPKPDSTDGASAADAARALAPLLEELRPDAVVSDILTLAPALAAEVAGVPRATLIPHIYPVHEPGLPFFAVGVQPPRTPVGRAMWRAGLPILETGLRRGREELNAQRARLGPAATGALPRRHQPRAGAGGDLSPARVPAALAAGGEGDRPDGLRAALPRHRAAAGRGSAGPGRAEHLAGSATTGWCGRRWRRWRKSRCGWWRRPTGSSVREPIEVPANAVLVDWLSYSQVMPAGIAGRLPRRPWNRGAVAGVRRAGAGPARRRRHGGDGGADQLGRGRALDPLAALPARAAALGGAGDAGRAVVCGRGQASSRRGRGRTTARCGVRSWWRTSSRPADRALLTMALARCLSQGRPKIPRDVTAA